MVSFYYNKNIFFCAVLLFCSLLLCGCETDNGATLLVGEKLNVSEAASEETSAAEEKTIYVYICGAVMTPGVYELPENSRVADGLSAAGGLLPEAAEDAINLAATMEDGEKIRFPYADEVQGNIDIQGAVGSDGAKVNINTASVTELCTLSGIGESRAKDIVAYRESHGSFRTIEDLMQVSGIKESVFNKVKDSIKVK